MSRFCALVCTFLFKSSLTHGNEIKLPFFTLVPVLYSRGNYVPADWAYGALIIHCLTFGRVKSLLLS